MKKKEERKNQRRLFKLCKIFRAHLRSFHLYGSNIVSFACAKSIFTTSKKRKKKKKYQRVSFLVSRITETSCKVSTTRPKRILETADRDYSPRIHRQVSGYRCVLGELHIARFLYRVLHGNTVISIRSSGIGVYALRKTDHESHSTA